MTLADAIREVSGFYVVGAVAFYDQMQPNPWQAAVDDLDEALKQNAYNHYAIDNYVERLRGLCTQFKRWNRTATGMTSADAFYLADPDRVKRWASNKEKSCIKCGRRAGKHKIFGTTETETIKLRVRAVAGSETEVELVCEGCS